MIKMDVGNYKGFSSPEEAFQLAAKMIRAESEQERKLAMRQEQCDRFNPDIQHYDYAAARLEVLARNLETWAGLIKDQGDPPNECEPPLIGQE